jgi:hypothetical protein
MSVVRRRHVARRNTESPYRPAPRPIVFVASYGEKVYGDDPDTVHQFLSVHKTFTGAVRAVVDKFLADNDVHKPTESDIEERFDRRMYRDDDLVCGRIARENGAQEHASYATRDWKPSCDAISNLLYAHTWDDAFELSETDIIDGESMRVVIYEIGRTVYNEPKRATVFVLDVKSALQLR